MLSLYGMTREELLSQVNVGLKRPLEESDIFSPEIKLTHLKRVDKVFNHGINFYLDPQEIEKPSDTSIFFRKKSSILF